jgi:flagellar motor protein MotB
MAKLKKLALGVPPRDERDESEVRWLISYSDFMMQLVCLFILLYSVSSLDKGRMARMASSYRASVGLGELAAYETRSEGTKLALGERSLLGGRLGGGDLPRELRYRLEPVAGGWRAAFSDPLFAPGSSVLQPGSVPALDSVARVLRAYAGSVVITGTGDETPGSDPLRLGALRARAVADRLAQQGLDPRFLVSVGSPRGEPGRVTLELRTQ